MQAGKAMGLFNNQVKVIMTGRAWGDCNPQHENGQPNLFKVAAALNVSTIFAPRVKMTNQISRFELQSLLPQQRFIRSELFADGGLINRPDVGVCICPADCPVGILFHPASTTLVMIHLGLNCFYRQDGSPSIIDNALRELDLPCNQLHFWISPGIADCCYGFDFVDERLRREYPDCFDQPTSRGPRRGKTGVNIQRMLWHYECSKYDFASMAIEPGCTSCMGSADYESNEYGEFFSNVRDLHQTHERNCVMAGVE